MASTDDWAIDLMKAHPRLFKITTDRPYNSLDYPFCKTGWRDVLVRHCTRIKYALQCNETFHFTRIKQKFGVALFVWSSEVAYTIGYTRVVSNAKGYGPWAPQHRA
jgi:hypothetical protein